MTNDPTIDIFPYSHHLPTLSCSDIVRRNSVSVTPANSRVKLHNCNFFVKSLLRFFQANSIQGFLAGILENFLKRPFLYFIFHFSVIVFFKPLTPKICLLILPSICLISFQLSYKNLVLDQDNYFYLISLNILNTSMLDNVWII